jgi:hypothetical protein
MPQRVIGPFVDAGGSLQAGSGQMGSFPSRVEDGGAGDTQVPEHVFLCFLPEV